MNDFININTTAFNEAVHEATATLAGDVSTLFDKVRALETTQGIDGTQFDGNEAAFDQRVLDVLSDNDYSTDDVVRDIAESAVRDIDWSDIVNDYVTEDVVKGALGLGRYDEIMDREFVQDAARDVVREWDIDDFVTANAVEDMMDERLSEYVTKGEASMVGGDGSNLNEQALMKTINLLVRHIGHLTEDLANMRTLCGMEPTTHHAIDMAEIVWAKCEAFVNVDTPKEVA